MKVPLQPVRFGQLRYPPIVPLSTIDPYWDEIDDIEVAPLLEACRNGHIFDGTLISAPTQYNDREVIPHLNDPFVHRHLRQRWRVNRQEVLQEEWYDEERERQERREETADWEPEPDEWVPIPDPVPVRKRVWSEPCFEEYFWKHQYELLVLIGTYPVLVLEGGW